MCTRSPFSRSPNAHLPGRRANSRGFTLLELVIVVVIIGLLAAIAIPSVTKQLRDRRSNQAAQTIANLYRGARMRAMGRGSSVLVRYQKDSGSAPAGAFEVWEGIAGTGGACGPVPRRGCQAFPPPGGTPPNTQQLVGEFNPGLRSEYDGLDIAMQPATGTGDMPFLDVCFTPMGATYTRNDTSAQVLTRMTGINTAQVTRSGVLGRRDILILPSGAARVKGKFVTEAGEGEGP